MLTFFLYIGDVYMQAYKIENVADAIFLEQLATTESISGTFYKESQYPFRLFWHTKSRKDIGLDEVKVLKKDVKKSNWADIFEKRILQRDKSNGLSHEIIIKCTSKADMQEIMKGHFKLQQGKCFFSGTSRKGFFLRIQDPSRWVLDTKEFEGDITIYNLSDIYGVYIERGFTTKSQFTKTAFSVEGQAVMLIGEDGDIEQRKIEWSSMDHAVILKLQNQGSIKPSEKEARFELAPKLIEGADKKEPMFWYCDDIEKASKILRLAPADSLDCMEFWFTSERTMYWTCVYKNQENSYLRNLATEAFKPFYKYEEGVYLPVGKTMLPRLRRNRILEAVEGPNSTDCIVVFEDDRQTLISARESKPMKDAVFFLAEQATRDIPSFQSQWIMDFHDLIPNPITVISDDGRSHIQEESSAGINFKDVVEETTFNTKAKVSISDQIKKISEIDTEINKNPVSPRLWNQRATLSRSISNKTCANIANLTAVATSGNVKDVIAEAKKICAEPIITEIDKQKRDDKSTLLVNIRSSQLPGELYFVAQMMYAKKYNDEDVFNSCINEMRTGYLDTTESHKLHMFADFTNMTDLSSWTMDEEAIGKLNKIVRDFIDIFQGITSSRCKLVARQFQYLININLGIDMAMPEVTGEMNEQAWQDLMVILSNPEDEKRKGKGAQYKLWISKMQKLDLENIQGILTGDVHRAIHHMEFKNECENTVTRINSDYINGSDISDYFKFQDDPHTDSETMRLLLVYVMKYGADPALEKYIFDYNFKDDSFENKIMNCDVYRIRTLYGIEDQHGSFFTQMLKLLGDSDQLHGHVIDYVDVMENMSLCLLISDFEEKEETLMEMIRKSVPLANTQYCNPYDLMNVLAYQMLICITINLPNISKAHNFYLKKKQIWMTLAWQAMSEGM